jgi:hypothetical protein
MGVQSVGNDLRGRALHFSSHRPAGSSCPQEVDRTVSSSDLEVPVVLAVPAVDHLEDLDARAFDLQTSRGRAPAR